jgi:hypothetical protein
MIKLTVKQLLAATEASPGRSSALQSFLQLPKPTQVSWANRKLIASCNEELKHYHEHRLELCKKRGTLNPKTNRFDFETPAVEALFNIDLAALQDQVIEPGLAGNPIKIADLGGALSEIDLALLEPFITD